MPDDEPWTRMPNPVDVHVGRRLETQREEIAITREQLAAMVESTEADIKR